MNATTVESVRTLPRRTATARPKPTKPPKTGRKRGSGADGRRFLIPGAVAFALILAIIGLVVPELGLLFVGAVAFGAGAAGLVGGFWIWGLAFQEDLLCGLLFFVPFYGLYYLVTRWEDDVPFWLVAGSVLANFGLIAYQFLLIALW